MGNEMGNNNTSEFREEEEKAEAPEKSLLESGGNEVKADGVADFHQKEARSGSNDADRVNGGHHVTEREEGKNEAFNTAEFQVMSEKSTDRTQGDNEVQTEFKDDETMVFDSKENGSDGNESGHEKQTSNQKEEEGLDKGSNLNTTILQLDEPELEKISDFKSIQNELPDTKTESLVADSDKSSEECKDVLGLSLNHTDHSADCAMSDSEKSTNMNQGIDTDRDMDKEKDRERGKGSNFNRITHASDDPKSENILDLESTQKESPETKSEAMVGSSDESPQESKYGLESSLEHTEASSYVIDTQKSTNVDHIGAETGAEVEKEKDGLIEPRLCHEDITPAAKIVDTKDEETETDLASHNSSSSQSDESLVIESPKPAMQVPEVDDRCTVLKEEIQMKEEPSGTGTVVQDNIPTQFKISNGIQEEFSTIGSHSENSAKETEVSPDSVIQNKNQNEAPGEDSEGSDGEYLEIYEQGIAILTLSGVGDCNCKNEEMGEATEISTNTGREAERRESEQSLSEPVLGFQPQIHLQETSIGFQSAEITDESIIAPRQETETEVEKSKRNPPDSSPASATSTETKPSTNPIDEQSVTTLPFSTFREKDQETPGRTSNESNSDSSIGHIEMRKSPSFNIDIQSEGRAGETEKIPLLYQIKTIEDLPNLQEISFPNPSEKRVVTLGRSDSEKSRPSFPGFAKEKEEVQMEIKAINQHNLTTAKKAAEDSPPTPPIRKGKRRTKSLIFGTCICCATAIR
ncbi:dentin matrix acidic phosphoprotein 1 isoform X2 [Momordica charantia]|nr:dentin matrix acidic phosphoprotein 1 isoform X2 [Momordica charantia]XP_022137788.1 dentin matrix acidic phosphoprotein 1 isoform X2 [Momordica charantia]